MSRFYKKLITLLMTLTIILTSQGLMLNAQAATATSKAGIVNTLSTPLNVRTAASYDSATLVALAKGSYVTLMSKSNGWWKVEYASGSYGYVNASYIAEITGANAAAVSNSVTSLNVRSGPGTTYAIKSVLPGGKIIMELSSANGWSKILYNGTQTGYASSKYIVTRVLWPVPASSKINQYYVEGTHKGIDIGASIHGVPGDKIIAAANGTVIFSGVLNGYGNVVYINSVVNGQNIQTRYGHLDKPSATKAGDTVSIGQTIGYMGNTGTSTGVHLHFEVRIRSNSGTCLANSESTPVNPLNYVRFN